MQGRLGIPPSAWSHQGGLRDQFFAAGQKFHTQRHLYEAKRENLKALEADLLKYTDEYQEMPRQAEYVGEGTWRVLGGTFSAMQRDCECCWDYVCNTFSGNGVSFPEAVAFLAGHAMADRWLEEKAENDAMHQAAAEEGRDAEDVGDAIQLTVAT